ESLDGGVAIHLGGQLDHVDEPAAAVAASVGEWQLHALDAGDRLAIQDGGAVAPGQQLDEALELRYSERAGEGGAPVVEPEPGVVEPAHVGRAALVALAVDALLHLRRRAHDHSALAGGH